MNKVTIEGLSKVKLGGTMLAKGRYSFEILEATIDEKDGVPNALSLHCNCLDSTPQEDGTTAAGVRRYIKLFFPGPQDKTDINKEKIKGILEAIDLFDGSDGFDLDLMPGRKFNCTVDHYYNANKGRTFEQFGNFSHYIGDDVSY